MFGVGTHARDDARLRAARAVALGGEERELVGLALRDQRVHEHGRVAEEHVLYHQRGGERGGSIIITITKRPRFLVVDAAAAPASARPTLGREDDDGGARGSPRRGGRRVAPADGDRAASPPRGKGAHSRSLHRPCRDANAASRFDLLIRRARGSVLESRSRPLVVVRRRQ